MYYVHSDFHILIIQHLFLANQLMELSHHHAKLILIIMKRSSKSRNRLNVALRRNIESVYVEYLIRNRLHYDGASIL